MGKIMTDVTKGFGKVVGNGSVEEAKMTLAECKAVIEELEGALCLLEGNLGSTKKFKMSRKEMVMEVIKDGREYSVGDIAAGVSLLANAEITNKNISSQLSYLRDDFAKDGGKYDIVRVGRGHGKLKLIKVD